MDMRRASGESSNAYLYSLANELGVDTMHDFMKPLGFGQMTGIDVLGEVRGVLPSQDWKRRYYSKPEHQKWYAGETISLGIGQGYNRCTMLQLAQATATLQLVPAQVRQRANFQLALISRDQPSLALPRGLLLRGAGGPLAQAARRLTITATSARLRQ
jgi:hypothetical protein